MATTFLILSDTHDDAFPDPVSLPSRVDVVLHCGDLTMIGGLSNYKKAIANIKVIDAELKLVIAGNHDNLIEDEDDPEEPVQALALFTAEKGNGLHFLEEGTHKFTLSDGRTFRFDPGVEHPIPEGVDIVMTHGPPLLPSQDYMLDINLEGNHYGCPMLYNAIRQARPKLHCFGHLHEGYGFGSLKPRAWEDGCTVLVNAAVMGHGEENNNKPWVVRLELDY
ncbi:Metallo-dependent phosphatase-like protein [Lasiosphaeris hirsuta]|uniref:Metallo-dependent phosphatase-like protein n=1 Tax=Lasiosphaeris hirsuta TaxID=260670 RepID=A0AA40A2V8_9PEZI|nr:Metallo-dependent phosphatase-like protein [Lasiosphaeris hirsuta]